MSVDAILKEVANLSDDEIAELMNRLLENWPPKPNPDASPELLALLEERDAAYEANPTALFTPEQVLAHVKRKR